MGRKGNKGLKRKASQQTKEGGGTEGALTARRAHQVHGICCDTGQECPGASVTPSDGCSLIHTHTLSLMSCTIQWVRTWSICQSNLQILQHTHAKTRAKAQGKRLEQTPQELQSSPGRLHTQDCKTNRHNSGSECQNPRWLDRQTRQSMSHANRRLPAAQVMGRDGYASWGMHRNLHEAKGGL